MRGSMFNSIMSSNSKCQVCIKTSKQNYTWTIIPYKYYCSVRPTTVNSFERSRGNINLMTLLRSQAPYNYFATNWNKFFRKLAQMANICSTAVVRGPMMIMKSFEIVSSSLYRVKIFKIYKSTFFCYACY